jgi:hypothetical protein
MRFKTNLNRVITGMWRSTPAVITIGAGTEHLTKPAAPDLQKSWTGPCECENPRRVPNHKIGSQPLTFDTHNAISNSGIIKGSIFLQYGSLAVVNLISPSMYCQEQVKGHEIKHPTAICDIRLYIGALGAVDISLENVAEHLFSLKGEPPHEKVMHMTLSIAT